MLDQRVRATKRSQSVTGRRIGQWTRGLCAALAVALGLQGTPAQAQTVYYHNDSAGSPVAATDEVGNLLWKESYRPYGERMLKPATSNTQWFHGKQLDPDTGMEDFGARNYDPVLGRFLSIDPVDFQDKNIHSFNRYAYGNNNPLKYKDPDGRAAQALAFIALVGVAWVALGGYVGSPQNGPSGPPPTPGQREAGVSSPPLQSPTSQILGQIGGFVETVRGWRDSIMEAKSKTSGETTAAADGRRAHQNYGTALGAGWDTGVILPSGKKPDAVNFNTKEVRELKSSNPASVRKGETQVEGYRQELESMFPGETWTGAVDVYRPLTEN